jgi:predicted TIM-barrel fold metal-dependent hydrolase
MVQPAQNGAAPTTPRRVIDAHHHIWRQTDLAWLAGPMQPRIFGPYESIRRDYSIDEYLSDVRSAGIVKSVYVQTNWPPGRELDEAEWVQGVADRHGFPHAIVAYADLAAEGVAQVLDRLSAFPNLRGIRQQLHWHENAEYRFAARPDLMNASAWRRGLAEVTKRGLLFELQVFADQMENGAALAHDFPETQFVLLHAGMLEDRSPTGWERWRRGMALLASCANVSAKLSGLGTFLHRCDATLWRPVIEETVALFGADRCLFGSNFPIEKIWTSYDTVLAAVTQALDAQPPAVLDAVLYGTASRLYRI